jgi:hypothetical protein
MRSCIINAVNSNKFQTVKGLSSGSVIDTFQQQGQQNESPDLNCGSQVKYIYK